MYFSRIVLILLIVSGLNAQLVEKGSKAPGFFLFDTQNNEFYLSKHLDKPLFINFFNTHCSPCLAEIPDLITFYNKHNDSINMALIDYAEFSYPFVDRRETVEDVQKALKRFNIPFPILMDNYGIVTKAYGVSDENPNIPTGLPVSFIIGTDGSILWVHGGRTMVEDLEKLERVYETIF
tara:strand:- start:2765 stop:3301 length:537 start_codon:yes stop_codon:yes gene_type:complete